MSNESRKEDGLSFLPIERINRQILKDGKTGINWTFYFYDQHHFYKQRHMIVDYLLQYFGEKLVTEHDPLFYTDESRNTIHEDVVEPETEFGIQTSAEFEVFFRDQVLYKDFRKQAAELGVVFEVKS